MNISIVDAFIVMFIILGAIIGYKHGAIREGTKFIGTIVVLIISFLLKDSLMTILYENLPFFNFFGLIKGIDAVNILFYQLISFLFIFLALTFILRVLIVITGLVEWLLKLTIFFSIPSKIIGIFVGALEYYVYVFIVLFVLNMPAFNLTYVNDSKFGNSILNNTPILSGMVDNTVEVYSDVWSIIKNKNGKSNSEINTLVLATLLDNKLITIDSARKLVDSNKIIISNPSILDKYEDNGNFYDIVKEKYDNVIGE
jgi:uncharacterized membrane protein required for colicin V production